MICLRPTPKVKVCPLIEVWHANFTPSNYESAVQHEFPRQRGERKAEEQLLAGACRVAKSRYTLFGAFCRQGKTEGAPLLADTWERIWGAFAN